MDLLKSIFPFSFGAKKDVVALVVNILIYLVAGAVAGVVLGLLGRIPVLGLLFRLLSGLVGLYCLVGIVLSVLDFMNVLK